MIANNIELDGMWKHYPEPTDAIVLQKEENFQVYYLKLHNFAQRVLDPICKSM